MPSQSDPAQPPAHIPHGRTARRLTWAHLPPPLRSAIERRLGSEVTDAVSQEAGFTPGFASVLTCADGSRHFVKAASAKAQRAFAAAYAHEAARVALLPPGVPAPRLLWSMQEDWVVLGFEYVEARAPHRPWRPDDLAATLDALETAARLLTPAADLPLDSFADDVADFPAMWEQVARIRPDLPHLSEAADLAAGFAPLTAGDTVIHSDVRDDNVLIRPDGRALLCDWNWLAIGADWVDSVLALIGPRGDGLDVAACLGERPLLRRAPAEGIDALLALVTGYFWKSAAEPVPASSPHIRAAQQWQGDVCWEWLCERRGWDPGPPHTAGP